MTVNCTLYTKILLNTLTVFQFLVKDGRQFLRLSIPLAERGQFVQRKVSLATTIIFIDMISVLT